MPKLAKGGRGPGPRREPPKRKPPAPQGPKRPPARAQPKRGARPQIWPRPAPAPTFGLTPQATATAAPTYGPFPLSAAEQAIIGTPDEGAIRDLVNLGSLGIPTPELYVPTIGPTVAQQALQTTLDLGGLGYCGGGGGGGLSVPVVSEELPPITSIKWKQGSFNLKDSKAPTWWKSLVPENAADMERPDVAYIAMLNTMIPYMSPEDQKRAAGLIYETVGGDQFGHYEQVQVQAPISAVTAGLTSQKGLPVIDTQYYQSAARASGAVDALSQLREMTVGGEREKIGGTGIGYRFLQDLLAQIQAFGGPRRDGQTRAQQLAMQGALDPIMAQAQTSEVGPVGVIAQMLSQPFFSQGSLYPFTKGGNRVFFGQPNPILYG